MGKDTRLVNIYIKIHNKRNLTIEDLQYLSKYDPECFEKTCKNVVYNVPDAKEVLQPQLQQGQGKEPHAWAQQGRGSHPTEGQGLQQGRGSHPTEGQGLQQGRGSHPTEGQGLQQGKGSYPTEGQGLRQGRESKGEEGYGLCQRKESQADKEQMELALSNLKRIEQEGLPVGDVDVDTVKNLLGNLYMEMLFPHNGRAKFFSMEDQEYLSVFNKKV